MKKLNQKSGFTLVEVLVSVALFSVVMVVALGALVSLSSAVRRAEALDTATNNLSAALESMSRTLRTGSVYHCGFNAGALTEGANCPTLGSAASSITFKSGESGNPQITYCLSNPGSNTCNFSTTCGSGSCTILRSKDGGVLAPLTAPEVNINNLKFMVVGASRNDGVQPRVVILLVGTIKINQDVTSSFKLQTSVTQHIYDQ